MNKAVAYLAQRDVRLARILTGPPFKARGRSELFLDLLESIMSQQLSWKAAMTIHGRFCRLFPAQRPTPRRLLKLTLEQLRAVGVSRQKAGYLHNVARFFLEHDLCHANLQKLDDAAILALLTQIKGVGRWTVEMILMFSLRRPDVFPVDDLGIQLAIKQLYGLRTSGARLRKRMEALAEVWRPHRTLASRYLWRWRSAQS